jgi:lipopolysaccharide/colanic/teichoic acid biosynthesis glycosyltransferase
VPDTKKLPKKAFWSRRFFHIPLIERWESLRDSLTLMSVKRVIDLLCVGVSTLFILPVCLIIACMIKLDDNGPVLYVSRRVGKNGKMIKFYKFRTMVANADEIKKELLRYNERKDGPLFKMHNDPRMTRLGKLLRRLSLDELPQLLNVLRGDISLIGPRPHLISEVKEYGKYDRFRLECFPGIIGLPQMYGSSFSGFREIVDLDLFYRRNWSLHLDMKILAMGLKFVILPFLSHNF